MPHGRIFVDGMIEKMLEEGVLVKCPKCGAANVDDDCTICHGEGLSEGRTE